MVTPGNSKTPLMTAVPGPAAGQNVVPPLDVKLIGPALVAVALDVPLSNGSGGVVVALTVIEHAPEVITTPPFGIVIVPVGDPESLLAFRVHAPEVATLAGRPWRVQPLSPTDAMLTSTPPVPVFVFPGEPGIDPVPVTLVHRRTIPPVVVNVTAPSLTALMVPPAGEMVVAAEAIPAIPSVRAAVEAAIAIEREMKRDEFMGLPFHFSVG